MNYSFPDHRKGDTFPGLLFKMQKSVGQGISVMDLTNVHIRMDLRVSATGGLIKRFTNYDTGNNAQPGGGITITDALAGEWAFDEQIIDLPPGKYIFDIEFTFLNPPVKVYTLLEGTWTFLQDISYD